MKKQHVLVLGVLLAALAALLFAILPITANLIVACVFWLIGIVFLIVSVYALGARDKSLIMELPLFIKARRYFILTATISAVVLLLENLGIFTLPFVFHLIVQIAAVLIVGVGVIMLNLSKSHIKAVGAKAADARNTLMVLVADVNALKVKADELPADIRPKIKKTITDVSDALRYADPISTPAVGELDEKIVAEVAEFKQAVSTRQVDEALNHAKALLANIKERNERNKNAKG